MSSYSYSDLYVRVHVNKYFITYDIWHMHFSKKQNTHIMLSDSDFRRISFKYVLTIQNSDFTYVCSVCYIHLRCIEIRVRSIPNTSRFLGLYADTNVRSKEHVRCMLHTPEVYRNTCAVYIIYVAFFRIVCRHECTW